MRALTVSSVAGKPLKGWRVYPMFVEDLSQVAWQDAGAAPQAAVVAGHLQLAQRAQRSGDAALATLGPTFHRQGLACVLQPCWRS